MNPNRLGKRLVAGIYLTFLTLLAIGSTLLASSNFTSPDVFFVETFDPNAAVSARWGGTTATGVSFDTVNSNSSLVITIGTGGAAIYTTATLSTTTLQSRRIILRAKVKGSNIALNSGAASYQGIKVMLIYQATGGGLTYDQIDFSSTNSNGIGTGTFDWKTVSKEITLPASLTNIKLQLALENATGSVYFDEVRVEADPFVYRDSFNTYVNTASLSSSGIWTSSSSAGSSSFSSIDTSGGYTANGLKVIHNPGGAGSYSLVTTTLSAAALAEIKGHRVTITNRFKGSGISAMTASSPFYAGIKVYLSIHSPTFGTEIFSNQGLPTGTFGWVKSNHFTGLVRSDADWATVTFGMKENSGTVWFDDLRVEKTPLLFNENFDGNNGANSLATAWSGGTFSTVSHSSYGNCYQMSATGSSNMLHIDLPVDLVRGRLLLIKSLIKASNVTAPPNAWNGIKVMLVYCTNDNAATNYPQLSVPYSIVSPATTASFDWTKYNGVIGLPTNITSATLYMGLEAITGTVCFDNLTIEAIDNAFVDYINPNPTTTNTTTLRGTMVSPSLSLSDLTELKSWKANIVRWQLGATSYPSGLDTPTYSTALNNEIAKLDALLPNLSSQGFKVVVDLHSLSSHLFLGKTQQDQLRAAWGALAGHYASSSYSSCILGYDLANEPTCGTLGDDALSWNELIQSLTATIRRNDTTHAVIVESEGTGEALGFNWLRPVDDSNAIYSFHSYEPTYYTHQYVTAYGGPNVTTTYFGTIQGQYWDNTALTRCISPVLDFQKRFQTPIYVGEFSAVRWAPGARQYMSDNISLFEQYGWNWTYHAFREWQGWSVEWDSDINSTAPSATNTDRKRLLLEWFNLN